MDYGRLIRRSWQLTWRHRFLWVLGLFATSTVGSCAPGNPPATFQWRLSPADFGRFYTPDVARALQNPDPWLSRNINLIFIGVVLLALLLLLVLFIVTLIAQGGMAEATADLALGRGSTPGRAWRTGLSLFGRYLLLWLLLIGLGILIALVLAAVLGVGYAVGSAILGPARTILMVLEGALAVVLAIVSIPVFIGLSVVVAFAQRAIPLESAGPWAALRIGYRLVRRVVGTTAVVWLISLALSIGVGIVVAMVVLGLLALAGAAGFGLYSSIGVTAGLIAYGGVAAVAVLAGIWFLVGVANTFFWNYWTITYLYLTGRLDANLEPVGI